MPEIPFPRGVKDLMPNEALFKNELLKKIESIYQRFGFLTIDTPAFEHLKVLTAKDGIGEGEKQIYEIKDEELALRYDHTVSLARYFAMHQSLPMPFKRYYIGKIWRKEEPQKNRYREITQADVDIIGGEKAQTDAEVIAAAATVLDEIGVEYSIHLNSREIINGILAAFGIDEEKHIEVIRAVDKYDKIGMDGVAAELTKAGIEKAAIEQITSFASMQGSNEEKLAYAKNLIKNAEAVKELEETLELLSLYRINGEAVVDFSIMRGFNYYTGLVVEFIGNGRVKGSICGGGRYDNLIGIYGGKDTPAVGVSIGVDRIMDALDYAASPRVTYAKVFVAYINESNRKYAIEIAERLRAGAVNTELNLAKRNLANQLAYADSLKLKYAVIVGDAEQKLGKIKLRNMLSGSEELLSLDEALKVLKSNE
ncbi:MAG: histidine--tRNA ligase [Candidatus Micrarchaeaceae archaeon]